MRKFTADFETNVDELDCRVWAYALCEIGDEKNFIYGNNIDDFIEFFKNENGTLIDSKLHEPMPPVPSAYHLFAEAVRDNTDFLVKAEEGVTVMRLLDAIYESAATGAPVRM